MTNESKRDWGNFFKSEDFPGELSRPGKYYANIANKIITEYLYRPNEELPSINDTFDKAREAMRVINSSQKALWELSHKIREKSDRLGHSVWMWSLQIEHALKILNEEIFAEEGYFE